MRVESEISISIEKNIVIVSARIIWLSKSPHMEKEPQTKVQNSYDTYLDIY
jgi:hypothetical protein